MSLQKQTLRNIIEERYKKTASRDNRVQRMLSELDEEINTLDDMEVFILTCENIMLPLQQAISNIPSDDREFTLNIAKSYLERMSDPAILYIPFKFFSVIFKAP